MNDEIDFVRVSYDLKGANKITKYKNGMIKSEPITAEQAALISAQENGY